MNFSSDKKNNVKNINDLFDFEIDLKEDIKEIKTEQEIVENIPTKPERTPLSGLVEINTEEKVFNKKKIDLDVSISQFEESDLNLFETHDFLKGKYKIYNSDFVRVDNNDENSNSKINFNIDVEQYEPEVFDYKPVNEQKYTSIDEESLFEEDDFVDITSTTSEDINLTMNDNGASITSNELIEAIKSETIYFDTKTKIQELYDFIHYSETKDMFKKFVIISQSKNFDIEENSELIEYDYENSETIFSITGTDKSILLWIQYDSEDIKVQLDLVYSNPSLKLDILTSNINKNEMIEFSLFDSKEEMIKSLNAISSVNTLFSDTNIVFANDIPNTSKISTNPEKYKIHVFTDGNVSTVEIITIVPISDKAMINKVTHILENNLLQKKLDYICFDIDAGSKNIIDKTKKIIKNLIPHDIRKDVVISINSEQIDTAFINDNDNFSLTVYFAYNDYIKEIDFKVKLIKSDIIFAEEAKLFIENNFNEIYIGKNEDINSAVADKLLEIYSYIPDIKNHITFKSRVISDDKSREKVEIITTFNNESLNKFYNTDGKLIANIVKIDLELESFLITTIDHYVSMIIDNLKEINEKKVLVLSQKEYQNISGTEKERNLIISNYIKEILKLSIPEGDFSAINATVLNWQDNQSTYKEIDVLLKYGQSELTTFSFSITKEGLSEIKSSRQMNKSNFPNLWTYNLNFAEKSYDNFSFIDEEEVNKFLEKYQYIESLYGKKQIWNEDLIEKYIELVLSSKEEWEYEISKEKISIINSVAPELANTDLSKEIQQEIIDSIYNMEVTENNIEIVSLRINTIKNFVEDNSISVVNTTLYTNIINTIIREERDDKFDSLKSIVDNLAIYAKYLVQDIRNDLIPDNQKLVVSSICGESLEKVYKELSEGLVTGEFSDYQIIVYRELMNNLIVKLFDNGVLVEISNKKIGILKLDALTSSLVNLKNKELIRTTLYRAIFISNKQKLINKIEENKDYLSSKGTSQKVILDAIEASEMAEYQTRLYEIENKLFND